MSSPSSSLLSSSQKLWVGAYIRLWENRNEVDHYYNIHYNEFNGTGVEYFEVYKNRIEHRSMPAFHMHTMRIQFANGLTYKEIEDFMGISLEKQQICLYDKEVDFYYESTRFTELVYSYEGVKSGTKSAAKIQPFHT